LIDEGILNHRLLLWAAEQWRKETLAEITATPWWPERNKSFVKTVLIGHYKDMLFRRGIK